MATIVADRGTAHLAGAAATPATAAGTRDAPAASAASAAPAATESTFARMGAALKAALARLSAPNFRPRSLVDAARAADPAFELARAAHGRYLTAATSRMDNVTAIAGLSVILARAAQAARGSAGNAAACATRFARLMEHLDPLDRSALQRCLQIFDGPTITARLTSLLETHAPAQLGPAERRAWAEGCAQAALGHVGAPPAAPAPDAATGGLTRPVGNPHEDLEILMSSVAALVRQHRREAASVVRELVRLAGTNDTNGRILRGRIRSVLEAFPPEVLLERIATQVRPSLGWGLGRADKARAIAQLAYTRLVETHLDGLDEPARACQTRLETDIAALQARLAAGAAGLDPADIAGLVSTLRARVLGAPELSKAQRTQLWGLCGKLDQAATDRESSRTLLAGFTARIDFGPLPPEAGADQRLAELARRLREVEAVQTAATARRPLPVAAADGARPGGPAGATGAIDRLLPGDAAILEERLASAQTRLRGAIDTAVLDLFATHPDRARLAGADAPAVAARQALLKVADVLLRQGEAGPVLVSAFAAGLPPPGADLPGAAAALGSGVADALEQSFGAARWDTARPALLDGLLPAALAHGNDVLEGAARTAWVGALEARMVQARQLRALVPGLPLPPGAPSSDQLRAIEAAAHKAGKADALTGPLARWLAAAVHVEAGRADPERVRALSGRGAGAQRQLEQRVAQGLADRAGIALVDQSVARARQQIGRNQAAGKLAALDVTEAGRNQLEQRLLMQALAPQSRQRALDFTAALATTQASVHSRATSRDHNFLPHRERQAEGLKHSRRESFEQAKLEQVAKLQKVDERLAALAAARGDKVAAVRAQAGTHGFVLPPEVDPVTLADPRLAAALDAIVAADDAMRAVGQRADLKPQQRAAAAQRAMNTRNGLIETLHRNVELARLAPRDAGTAPGPLPGMPTLRQARDLQKGCRDLAVFDQRRQEIEAEKAALESAWRELVAASEGPASAADAAREVQELADQSRELRSLEALLLLTASTICDAGGHDPKTFRPAEHRGAILGQIKTLYGLEQARLGSSSERRALIARLLGGSAGSELTLAGARATFLGAPANADLAGTASDFVAADLRAASAALGAGDSFTYRLAQVGSLVLSVPAAATLPAGGLAGGAVELSAEQRDSVRVERLAAGATGAAAYRVTVTGGSAGGITLGFSAFLGALSLRASASGAAVSGAALTFDNLEKTQRFLASLAGQHDGSPDTGQAGTVELVRAGERTGGVSAALTLPDPARLFALDMMSGGLRLTGGLGLQADLGATSAWSTSGNEIDRTHTRERSGSVRVTANLFAQTGNDRVDAALGGIATKALDQAARLGLELSPEASLGLAVRQIESLRFRNGALQADSEVRRHVAAPPGRAALALAVAAREVSTNDPAALQQIETWLGDSTAGSAFRVVYRASEAAVFSYDTLLGQARACREHDPDQASRLETLAHATLRAAQRPVRLERWHAAGSSATSASGRIGNALAARALTLGPAKLQDRVEASSERLVDAIEIDYADRTQVRVLANPA